MPPDEFNFESLSVNFDMDRDGVFCGILEGGRLRTILLIVENPVCDSRVFSFCISDCNLPPILGSFPKMDVSIELGQDAVFTKLLE